MEKWHEKPASKRLKLDRLIDDFPDERFRNADDLYAFSRSDPVQRAVLEYALVLAKRIYKHGDRSIIKSRAGDRMIESEREQKILGIQNDVYILFREKMNRYCSISNHNSIEFDRRKFLIFLKGTIRNMTGYVVKESYRNSSAVTSPPRNTQEKRDGTTPKVTAISMDLSPEIFDAVVEPYMDVLTANFDPRLSPEERLSALEEARETIRLAKSLLFEIFERERALNEPTTIAAFEFLINGISEGGNYGRKQEIADKHGVSVSQLNNRLEGLKDRSKSQKTTWLEQRNSHGRSETI